MLWARTPTETAEFIAFAKISLPNYGMPKSRGILSHFNMLLAEERKALLSAQNSQLYNPSSLEYTVCEQQNTQTQSSSVMRCIMELRVLRYFLAIAQAENFTKAAEQLHLTQPTLSRQIAQLEGELGVKLFLRGTQTTALTEEGMLLRRRAEALLELADKTKQEVLSQRRDLEGVIGIGCGEFLATTVLADCIASFRKDNPPRAFSSFQRKPDDPSGKARAGSA